MTVIPETRSLGMAALATLGVGASRGLGEGLYAGNCQTPALPCAVGLSIPRRAKSRVLLTSASVSILIVALYCPSTFPLPLQALTIQRMAAWSQFQISQTRESFWGPRWLRESTRTQGRGVIGVLDLLEQLWEDQVGFQELGVERPAE